MGAGESTTGVRITEMASEKAGTELGQKRWASVDQASHRISDR